MLAASESAETKVGRLEDIVREPPLQQVTEHVI
jgi:hypothetical protein